jgi:hypothetical protein
LFCECIKSAPGSWLLKSLDALNQKLNTNVNIMLITTACFSGGWTIYKDLNISASTAAGPNELSQSWRESGSIRRYCGSMYTTAVINKLTRVHATDQQISKSLENKDEEKTYSQFARKTYEALFDIDRRAYNYKVAFGAQDGQILRGREQEYPVETSWSDGKPFPIFQPAPIYTATHSTGTHTYPRASKTST